MTQSGMQNQLQKSRMPFDLHPQSPIGLNIKNTGYQIMRQNLKNKFENKTQGLSPARRDHQNSPNQLYQALVDSPIGEEFEIHRKVSLSKFTHKYNEEIERVITQLDNTPA